VTTAMETPMSDKDQRTTSMRIGVEVVEAAKIAAAFKGVTMMEYVSRIVLEAANRDIEEGYRSRSAPEKRRRPKA
jgi:predicted DNA binding CopG/RHH family protein